MAAQYGYYVQGHEDEREDGDGHQLQERQSFCLAAEKGTDGLAKLRRHQYPDAEEQQRTKSLCQEEDQQGEDGRREPMEGHGTNGANEANGANKTNEANRTNGTNKF